MVTVCGDEDDSDDADQPTTGPSPERRDVVVIGAGAAGLTAGRQLAAAGVDVVVLDARDRVRGRTFNEATEDGAGVEAGECGSDRARTPPSR